MLSLEILTDRKWLTTIRTLINEFQKAIAPPEDLTVSEWADKYRILASETSARPGPWETDRAPYQREPMDAITDSQVRKVVMVAASQTLKTEVMLNAIGHSIHCDPCPMLMVQPDEKNADDFAKDRIGNLIKYTPVLRDLVYDSKTGVEDTRSSTFSKRFPGGYLSVASANVPASLSSKAIKKLFLDETDRYKFKSGREGDPITMARARLTSFWDSKEVMASSPGNLGESIIMREYETTDQRMYFVPCPHCGLSQTLKWGGPDFPYGIKWDPRDPSIVWYQCEGCGEKIAEAEKAGMNAAGVWIAKAPFVDARGYWINALYSPWISWVQLVSEFISAHKFPEKLQEFVKTRLAEPWEERGEAVHDDRLYDRREIYNAAVPDGAFVLTAGVDIQRDRIECLIYGWGIGEEAWAIEHAVFHGDPLQSDVWQKLESYISRPWKHQSGSSLALQAVCVDTSDGTTTHVAYEFCKKMKGRRVFAIKGDHGWGKPVKSSPSQGNRPVPLYMLGVDAIKEIIYSRLRFTQTGPGYFHFPKADWCNEEFFKQLTAEIIVVTVNKKTGVKIRVWKQKRPRNEILDMTGYAYAGLLMLPPNWQDWRELFVAKPQPKAGGAVQAPGPPKFQRNRSKGYNINDVLR